MFMDNLCLHGEYNGFSDDEMWAYQAEVDKVKGFVCRRKGFLCQDIQEAMNENEKLRKELEKQLQMVD